MIMRKTSFIWMNDIELSRYHVDMVENCDIIGAPQAAYDSWKVIEQRALSDVISLSVGLNHEPIPTLRVMG